MEENKIEQEQQSRIDNYDDRGLPIVDISEIRMPKVKPPKEVKVQNEGEKDK